MKKYVAHLGPYRANCYLFVDEKTGESVVFDVGGYNKLRIDKLFEETDEAKLKYIILTHRHYDHLSGVEELRLRTKAKVLISEADKSGLYDDADSLADHFRKKLNKCLDFGIISEGDVLKFGESEVKVLATPGHTSGSLTFIIDNYMISGDLIFKDSIGRVDLPTGDMNQMISSLKRIKALDKDYHICPGHGPETTLNEEKRNNPYLNI